MENGENKKTSGLTIVLILGLIISIGANIYQWSENSTDQEVFQESMDTLQTAKNEIETELNQTYAELDKFRGQNSQLDSILAEARDSLDASKSRINQLLKSTKDMKAVNAKLLAELESVKTMRDQYLDKIDSLMVANKQLTDEKEQLTGQVETLSKNLQSTVTTASVLKVEYVNAKAYKKRGSDKYSETLLAKRTNKVEVTFAVLDNKLAKAGERNIYLRLVAPDGKVVGNKSEGSKAFKSADTGEDLMFTSNTTINYNNDKQAITLFWEEAERGNFGAGKYDVEIYIDGIKSGLGAITLK